MRAKRLIFGSIIAVFFLTNFVFTPQQAAAQQQLPDLAIINVWQNDSQICYSIKNIGEGGVGGVVAPASFYKSLFINDTMVVEDYVTTSLATGQQLDRCFNYQWQATPGQHNIRVCADQRQAVAESNEANNCWQQVWVTEEEELPDLVVEKIEYTQDNLLSVTIRNVGSGSIPSGWKALADTYFDGVRKGAFDMTYPTTVINGGIEKPGGISNYIPGWYVTPPVKVTVIADLTNEIKESNEQNNCLEMILEGIADTTPPQITSGPSISKITQTSAVICWVTDEASDGLVRYDNRSGMFGSIIEDTAMVQDHCLSLSNLHPATTYRFMVESRDSSRNRVKSPVLSFETLLPSDIEKPSLSLRVSDTLSGRVTISADTRDDTGVDRVVFYLDGRPIYTDFTPPFMWECDTFTWSGGTHEFGAQAFDMAGNVAEDFRESTVRNPLPDTNFPTVTILNPRTGDSVIGSVPVEVEAYDEGYIKEIKIYIDGVYKHGWAYTKTYLDGVLIPPPKSKTLVYSWDTSSLEPDSTHVIEARAWDDANNSGHDGFRVTKARIEAVPLPAIIEPAPMPPSIDLRRHVLRFGNYFDVTLEIENTGSVRVSNVIIEDLNRGFQCLRGLDPCEITYSTSGKWSTVATGYYGKIDPGQIVSIQYFAVPILFDPYRLSDYVIGHARTALRCAANDTIYTWDFYLPFTPWTEGLDVEAAFRSADYLIVTNPYNLFATNSNHDDVNRLLCTMADLAKEKQGVLGYLYAPMSFRTTLDGNDALTLGDINNDGRCEILIGRVGGDEEGIVDMYGMSGWFSCFRSGLNRTKGLTAGDVLANEAAEIVTANITGSERRIIVDIYASDATWLDSPQRDFMRYLHHHDIGRDDAILLINVVGDEKKEVILAVHESRVHVWYYKTDRERWYEEMFTEFRNGDVMAAGDVFGGGEEEIIIASQSDGVLRCYQIVFRENDLLFEERTSITGTGFQNGDDVVLGDINGDSKEEIILGHRDSGRIDVYQYNDTGSLLLFSVDTSFDRGDTLAVGDVCGLPRAKEIIIAEDGGGTKGMVYIYGYHGAYIPHLATSFGTSFNGNDYLLVGDVTGDEFEEIVIGNTGGSEKGLVDIIAVMEGAPRDRKRLQELLRRDGGEWCNKLCPGWANEGYLLLVGETEIIPSFTAHWADKYIHFTDYHYASTSGQDKFAELCIGRIIGNTAAELIIPIQNSLDVWHGRSYFDRNSTASADALGQSGRDGEYNQEGKFWSGLCDICGWIDNEFYVVKYRGQNYDGDWILENFCTQVTGRDVIVYRGHGYDDGSGWAWGGGTSLGKGHLLGWWEHREEEDGTVTRIWHDPVVDFGPVCPFVFSLSCSSGKYAGISGVAEAFLQRGAAVYIASTETSITQDNNEGGDVFFDKWIGHHGHPDKTIGQAWKETRNWASDEWWGEGSTYWGAEYQLYGDPKYGKER